MCPKRKPGPLGRVSFEQVWGFLLVVEAHRPVDPQTLSTRIAGDFTQADDAGFMAPAAGACRAATLPVVVSNERVQVLDGPLVVKSVGVLDRAPVGDRRCLFAVADQLFGQACHGVFGDITDGRIFTWAHGKRRIL